MRTEHAGGKNGGGFWGTRAEAKRISRTARRVDDREAVEEEAHAHDWFSAWEDDEGNVVAEPFEGRQTPGLRWVTRCQACGVVKRG